MMFFLNNIILESGIIMYCKIINFKNVFNELVFNTSNYSYIESISDSSYKGQCLVFSNPNIGNVGFIKQDCQSYKIKLNAIIINNYCISSNFRNNKILYLYLKNQKIPILFNLDVRFLIHKIKKLGSQISFINNFKKNLKIFIYIRSLNLYKIIYD